MDGCRHPTTLSSLTASLCLSIIGSSLVGRFLLVGWSQPKDNIKYFSERIWFWIQIYHFDCYHGTWTEEMWSVGEQIENNSSSQGGYGGSSSI